MPVYEAQCANCGHKYEWYCGCVATDDTKNCPKCGGSGERLYSLAAVKVFQSFKTRNIDPGGREIEITSQSQLSHLCNEFKLTHVDDPKVTIKPTKRKSVGDVLGVNVISDRKGEPEGGAMRGENLI
jgi:putative FmdB family regulatory protein